MIDKQLEAKGTSAAFQFGRLLAGVLNGPSSYHDTRKGREARAERMQLPRSDAFQPIAVRISHCLGSVSRELN